PRPRLCGAKRRHRRRHEIRIRRRGRPHHPHQRSTDTGFLPLLARRGLCRRARAGQLRQAIRPRLPEYARLGQDLSRARAASGSGGEDPPEIPGSFRHSDRKGFFVTKKTALISVSDETGLLEFAQGLAALDIRILSTGGTLKFLKESGVPAVAISEYTGSPEILDGRVKTLHPKIHGGLLGIRDNEAHRRAMGDNGIEAIDIVAVNLYPFRETV